MANDPHNPVKGTPAEGLTLMGRNNKPAHFYKPSIGRAPNELETLATQIVRQASETYCKTGRPMKGIPGLTKPRKK